MFKPLAVLTQGRYDYVNVEELGVAVAQRDVVSRVLASPVGLGAERLRQCACALPPRSRPCSTHRAQWAGVSARQRRPRQTSRMAPDGFISQNDQTDRRDSPL